MNYLHDNTYNELREKSLMKWLDEMAIYPDLEVRGGVKLAKEYLQHLNEEIAVLNEKNALKDEYLKKMKKLKAATKGEGQIVVDLIIFMGQSNMAGRGITCEQYPENAPEVPIGVGYEYRAITEPNALVTLKEPFGRDENTENGINDSYKKTGGMTASFVNAYYKYNGNIPVVGVSASKGGSSLSDWQERYLADAVSRFEKAKEFLLSRNIKIRHSFMVWSQGETDGDKATPRDIYEEGLRGLFDTMISHGVEHIFTVQIGRCNIPGAFERYDEMIEWQSEFAEKYEDVTMVADTFKDMRELGLMKDEFHYYQQAYNEVGAMAGRNAGVYAVGE